MTGDSLWVGDTYRHGREPDGTSHARNYANVKGISPTKTTYQIGLHMGGGCLLPPPFNGCGTDPKNYEFCYKPEYLDEGTNMFRLYHFFDETVHTKDLKIIDKESEGVLLHILLNRLEKTADNKTRLDDINDYAALYFNRTLHALKERRLDLIVEAPFMRRALIPITSRNGI